MTTKTCRKCNRIFDNLNNAAFCPDCRWEKRICAVCGKPFETRPSLSKTVMTCSRKCGFIYQFRDVEKKRGERRPPCSYCGKPITRKGWKYGDKISKEHFCNTACHMNWRKENKVFCMENHPRWKGGTHDYYGNLWRKNRAVARARDKVCQRCGKTPKENGKALDVHHVKPFRDFGIRRQAEAHDLKNLVCYCSSCHQLVEWGS